METKPLRVGILGAGLIGLYMGGVLEGRGCEVTYFGRERMWNEIKKAGGLLIEGGDRVPVGDMRWRLPGEDSDGDLDVVLVTLKTQHIKDMGKAAPKLPENAVLVSMCNGLDSVPLLREVYPSHNVLHGMFGPNVIMVDDATMVKATSGLVLFDRHTVTQTLAAKYRALGLDCDTVEDVVSVKWGKLLINTNNAVNALSGLPLGHQLRQQGYRMVWAAAMREGLRVCAAEAVTPAKLTALPPNLLPYSLETPDSIFTRLAKKLVSIDERAGSSMLDDIKGGRPSEIAYLNGTLVALGAKHGIPTPVNSALVELVKQAEAAKCSPNLTCDELHAKVHEICGWHPVYYSTACNVM